MQKQSNLVAQVSEAVAWFDPELLTMSDETIWGYFDQEPKLAVYRHMIEKPSTNVHMSCQRSKKRY